MLRAVRRMLTYSAPPPPHYRQYSCTVPTSSQRLGLGQSSLSLLFSLSLSGAVAQAPGGARTAVVIEKTHATPKRYPRQAGIPKKTPL